MHLVQILLPVTDNEGHPFPSDWFGDLRQELTDQYGGVTVYAQAPAEGFWRASERTSRDEIVIFEVMCDRLNEPWWHDRRARLEAQFRQDQVLVRVQDVRVI
jgi:hypothetical protein